MRIFHLCACVCGICGHVLYLVNRPSLFGFEMELTNRIIAVVALSQIVKGVVQISDNDVCYTYKTNGIDSSAKYYEWNGARITDCKMTFTRVNRNTMVCINVSFFRITSCDQEVRYYKLLTNGTPPQETFGCNSQYPSNWCCNTGTVTVQIDARSSERGTFAFHVYAKPVNEEEDDCLAKSVTMITPKPPTNGILGTQALTEALCNSEHITVIDKYPAMYQWGASLGQPCTVGFHNAMSVDSSKRLCVEIVDFVFKDCRFKVEYYGISTAGDPKKVIDCNEKHNKWCSADSTVKIKFQAAQNADDAFVFKVYVGSSESRTCSINALLLIIAILSEVL